MRGNGGVLAVSAIYRKFKIPAQRHSGGTVRPAPGGLCFKFRGRHRNRRLVARDKIVFPEQFLRLGFPIQREADGYRKVLVFHFQGNGQLRTKRIARQQRPGGCLRHTALRRKSEHGGKTVAVVFGGGRNLQRYAAFCAGRAVVPIKTSHDAGLLAQALFYAGLDG